jgi:hypothetical protein
MSTERFIRHAAVTLIVLLAISYLWLRFPKNREDTSNLLDFSEFYAAGEIVREGMGPRLYDLKVQAEMQLRVAPVHAFYLRPPFEALLFVPLTFLSYRGAYRAWTILTLALLFGSAWLIQKNTAVLPALVQYTRGIPVDLGLLFVLFLTFEPTMDCFLIGQDSMLVLFIYTAAYLRLKEGRDLESGAILACGLFKFHLVLPFALIFALRRRWRFLSGFAGMGAALATVSLLVLGTSAITSYPAMFLNEGYRRLMGFQPEYAANIRGLVHLLAGGKVSAAIAGAIVALASLAICWRVAAVWDETQLELCFSAAVIAVLLTSVHSFVYDLSLLLLPIAIICAELARRQALLRNTPLNVCLILLFIPSVHHLLINYRVYSLMSLVLLVLFVIVMKTITRGSAAHAAAAGCNAAE